MVLSLRYRYKPPCFLLNFRKAVCVEAGMSALRRGATFLSNYILKTLFLKFKLAHEDFLEGIAQVQAKKKSQLDYFA